MIFINYKARYIEIKVKPDKIYIIYKNIKVTKIAKIAKFTKVELFDWKLIITK